MFRSRTMLPRPILVSFTKMGIKREEYISHVSFHIAEGLKLDTDLEMRFREAIHSGKITDELAERMREIDPDCFAREYRAANDRADSYIFHRVRYDACASIDQARRDLAAAEEAGDAVARACAATVLEEAQHDYELAKAMIDDGFDRNQHIPMLEVEIV